MPLRAGYEKKVLAAYRMERAAAWTDSHTFDVNLMLKANGLPESKPLNRLSAVEVKPDFFVLVRK
jgi:hypothetical protein